MPRKNASPVWKYFRRLSVNRAICIICNERYGCGTTTGYLYFHLKKKHPVAYNKLRNKRAEMQEESFDDEEKVIYLISENQKSDDDAVEMTTETDATLNLRDSTDSRTSVKKCKLRESHNGVAAEKKRLIEQLTEEKIAVASVQKELMEKQLEEINIKVLLLQEELEHRKHLYNLEKQEMERKKEIQELAKENQELTKEETLLKIELLKATLSKESTNCIEINSLA